MLLVLGNFLLSDDHALAAQQALGGRDVVVQREVRLGADPVDLRELSRAQVRGALRLVQEVHRALRLTLEQRDMRAQDVLARGERRIEAADVHRLELVARLTHLARLDQGRHRLQLVVLARRRLRGRGQVLVFAGREHVLRGRLGRLRRGLGAVCPRPVVAPPARAVCAWSATGGQEQERQEQCAPVAI